MVGADSSTREVVESIFEPTSTLLSNSSGFAVVDFIEPSLHLDPGNHNARTADGTFSIQQSGRVANIATEVEYLVYGFRESKGIVPLPTWKHDR